MQKLKLGKGGWSIYFILSFLLAACGSGANAPAATSTVTFQSFADFSTQIPPGSTLSAPPIVQVSGSNCYLIKKGDWPLKVLRRNGITTQPGNGPYTVIGRDGKVRVNSVKDWGYIGEVYAGEYLCKGSVFPAVQQNATPTPTPVYNIPTPTFTASLTMAAPFPEGTNNAVLPLTPMPTTTQVVGMSTKTKVLLAGAAFLVLVALVLFVWTRFRRGAG